MSDKPIVTNILEVEISADSFYLSANKFIALFGYVISETLDNIKSSNVARDNILVAIIDSKSIFINYN